VEWRLLVYREKRQNARMCCTECRANFNFFCIWWPELFGRMRQSAIRLKRKFDVVTKYCMILCKAGTHVGQDWTENWESWSQWRSDGKILTTCSFELFTWCVWFGNHHRTSMYSLLIWMPNFSYITGILLWIVSSSYQWMLQNNVKWTY